MVIENFVLNFSVFSEAKSYWAPELDEHIRVFNHQEVSNILGVESTFHFDRGDLNFFSQYGAAAYAFWAHSFVLTEEEAVTMNDDHDLALARLFEKLKAFVEEKGITKDKIEQLKSTFDCRCEVLFVAPDWINGMLFRVQPEDLLFMGKLGVIFNYREREKLQVEQLQQAAVRQ